jgi:hypothetical protein
MYIPTADLKCKAQPRRQRGRARRAQKRRPTRSQRTGPPGARDHQIAFARPMRIETGIEPQAAADRAPPTRITPAERRARLS